MSGNDDVLPPENDLIQFSMPKTALQALYNAATGKTETLYRELKNNVIITRRDVDQLYTRIKQQTEHYDLVAPPSVTVAVKMMSDRVVSYSSWERFTIFEVNDVDVTAEITLKFEFLVSLPRTGNPQRMIVNVSLNSGLPLMESEDNLYQRSPVLNQMFFGVNYTTVEVSISHVDFMLAKIFLGVVEEWFKTVRVLT